MLVHRSCVQLCKGVHMGCSCCSGGTITDYMKSKNACGDWLQAKPLRFFSRSGCEEGLMQTECGVWVIIGQVHILITP